MKRNKTTPKNVVAADYNDGPPEDNSNNVKDPYKDLFGECDNIVTDPSGPPYTPDDNSPPDTSVRELSGRKQTCEYLNCTSEVFSACNNCESLLCWDHFDNSGSFNNCDFHNRTTEEDNNEPPSNTLTMQHLVSIDTSLAEYNDNNDINTTISTPQHYTHGTMDAKYKRLLQQQYEAIIKDLDVSDIQDRLYEKGYFSTEEYERANSTNKSNRTDRTRDLLVTLMQTGNNAKYDIFVESLAKDYEWLWMKLKMESTETDMNESFEDSLSKGDVPRLPDHHVKRAVLESTVAAKLKQLGRHKVLALHGMSGCGKTCVAISALRDNPGLITDTFKGVVFWLNLGNCKTDDDIIAQQTKLLRKTSSIYKHNSFMISSTSMSSIGSNGDSLSLSNFDLNSQDLKDKLKVQFSEPPMDQSLLVLDEVNDRKCLQAFDIGCKILITTQDTGVVTDYQTQIIKIQNNFEKAESLELFASFLDEPVSRLPRQAKKLHEVCKGSPFHIALIGAQLAENKERLKDDPRLWDQYVKKLEKKEYSFFLTRPNDNPMKTVEMCINSLNEYVRPLYKKLAVLPDNVKVSAKVLGKLWGKDVQEVNSIMQQLKNKSLIIANYDRERRNYMYEVHDLIMNYLRTCWNDEDKKKLHDNFLNSYNYTKSNAPVEIVDDGYIAFYVGYHILNTQDLNQKWSLFKKLFLDLKFLGNKVRLTGPADVILDLQKYENHIASEELDRDLIHSIKAYLMTHGTDLHHYQCTDIIQSILQHETKGVLYTKASEIAQENCHKKELYFEFLHEQDVDGIKHSTIDVKEGITCVCFLGDYVLVGTQTGVVKFFHNPTNKLRKEYSDRDASHGHPVKWIGVAVSRNYPIVSVLYYNGTIKLWNIDDLDTSDTEDIIEEEPEELQNNNLPCNVTISPDSRIGAIRNCRWSANEEFLITHTDHQVVLYSPNGDIISMINGFDSECFLVCCVPCNNDRYLAVATVGTKQGVEVIDLKTNIRVMTFEGDLEMEQVQDVLSLPGSNKILTLTTTEITQHTFTINKGNNTLESKVLIISEAVKSRMSFLSFAVNKTGTLLFVSTDDSRVICIDLKTNTHVFDLDNRRGNVVAMAVSEILMWDEFIPGYDVLLTGTGTVENTVKVWHLDTSYISKATNKNGKVRLTTKFDVSFLNTASPVTPNTPSHSGKEFSSPPKRHQSFNLRETPKKLLQNTLSLDRQALKPLNLKGICNNNDATIQPLLAVIDDKNNIQVMRGRKILTEISENIKDIIATVKISPCNQHVIYGLKSGFVKRYTLRTKDSVTIMHVYSAVQYMTFVNQNLLIVAGENRCIMAHKLIDLGNWETIMLQKGNTFLGSQEILNDLQGVKKKHSDNMSNSESHGSIESQNRLFSNGDRKGTLCKSSGLVECFWITDIGLVTVESNASVKLWDKELKLACVLHARREDVYITCAAFKKNVLVICDSTNLAFQTLLLEIGSPVKLNTIREQKLNNVITCCDLTADGNLLALGLDSGDVLVWNVKGQRQITNGLLRHHKHKVQYCSFSPVPDRLYRNSTHSTPYLSPTSTAEDDQPPLVLVTMASEIVWWNVTYYMRRGNGKMSRPGVNVNALTPIGSPLEHRVDALTLSNDIQNSSQSQNFFFADGFINHNCWKDLWKGKTYKQGSKRKEILACVKLSGIHARRLRHDDRFSCFVTVDNTGHVHIMNVLRDACS